MTAAHPTRGFHVQRQRSAAIGQPVAPVGQRINYIGQRRDAIGQPVAPVGQRVHPIGQRRDAIGRYRLKGF